MHWKSYLVNVSAIDQYFNDGEFASAWDIAWQGRTRRTLAARACTRAWFRVPDSPRAIMTSVSPIGMSRALGLGIPTLILAASKRVIWVLDLKPIEEGGHLSLPFHLSLLGYPEALRARITFDPFRSLHSLFALRSSVTFWSRRSFWSNAADSDRQHTKQASRSVGHHQQIIT